ncbi:MAG: HDOD domain-containing protein [Fuerstiella sp.]|nr:HDOD domain-containing protein [Fuerstiella sp.]MCP4858210.1 HDOD domain-containing protein [Fuerstiella sp.]
MTTQTPEVRPSTGTGVVDAARSILQSDDYALPILPEVAVQLMNLTADVDCDPKDIVDLFKRDQSLTGHLLMTANSIRYNSGVMVTSMQQAVARLGLLRIREIVMLISVQAKVFKVAGFESDVRMSFEKSMTTAAFSQEIARNRRLNVEDAFLCGLLHDIGRPVLLQALSDFRNDGHANAADHEIIDAAAEYRIPLAGKLVLRWDLPERLATIIQHQQTPTETADFAQQAAILNLAIDLANISLDEDTEMPGELNHPMIGVLNLYPDDVAHLLSRHTEILEWVRSAT